MTGPTILDTMLGRPAPRDEALEKLIEYTERRVSMMGADELARAGAHEYDEEVIVPEPGSQGAKFLHAAGQAFSRWVQGEGRFPQPKEFAEVATDWHRDDAVGSQVAQAFVDLGLYYSQHASVAAGATIADFQKVLDEVAEQIVASLAEAHAPQV